MRILYLSQRFPLVSETFVGHEIADQLARGADIRVLSFSAPAAAERSTLPETHGYADRVITVCNAVYRGIGGRLRLLSDIMSQPVKIARLLRDPVRPKELSTGKWIALAVAVRHLTRTWKPEIVHCHFGPVGLIGMALHRAGIIDAKVTVTFHGYDISSYLRDRPVDIYQPLFNGADMLLAISDFWRQKLLRLGASEDRLQLFHMGVDCGKFAFLPRRYRPGAPIRLILVGRMTEKKGQEIAVRALAAACAEDRGLPLHLDLVGDGPMLAEITSLIGEIGMNDRITVHGALQHQAVQDMLARSDVFLLPSVTSSEGDMEGIPVALMEAMASGLPVISTHHSGIPELVEDGVSGWLVAERDIAALAQVFLDLPNQLTGAARIAAAARAKVEAEFDRHRQADRLHQIFQTVTN